MADIRDTIAQTDARRLPLQCGESAPGDFHLFGPLKKHLRDHICQTDVEVQDVVSKWFRSQNYMLQADIQ
jgi:hypothetical protein